MPIHLGAVFATDAGMLCLWNPAAFPKVVDYETWEAELCEDRDIRRHIKAGHFVPVNTNRGIDGAFAVVLRVGDGKESATRTERESRYLLAESQPYLFDCSGRVCLSGLEHVEAQPGPQVGCVPAAPGEYLVTVHFIGWDEEPGMKDRRGRPKPGALPDFVVLANPQPKGRVRFGTKVHALDDPK